METPSRKTEATRLRLLDAANRRFRASGFEGTTAAAIAEDAGVTERTFFRYFPTKADVLIANWQGHGDALREELAGSTKARVADVVRDALIAFTGRLEDEVVSGVDSVIRLYTDRAAFHAIMEMLLDVETDLAVEIAKRTSRPVDNFAVRVAANASFGVFRAAVRAYVVDHGGRHMSDMITEGMRRLRPCFAALGT